MPFDLKSEKAGECFFKDPIDPLADMPGLDFSLSLSLFLGKKKGGEIGHFTTHARPLPMNWMPTLTNYTRCAFSQ